MSDKDPSTYVTPASSETETTHEQDSPVDLEAVTKQIDDLLANDTEGVLKLSGRDPYDPKPI